MPSRTDRSWTTHSESGSSSGYSDSSDHSQSTAATAYSRTHSWKYQHAEDLPYVESAWEDPAYNEHVKPRISTDTYASTLPSTDYLYDEPLSFEVPDYQRGTDEPTAFASTPPDFSEYFPSTRRLQIRHDDATIDGNMNIRVDTEIPTSAGRKMDLTLFHLRMHDLKNREFSLRRYCRDSGREVCHSSRKYTKPTPQRRPGLQRSMSNAISSLRSKPENKAATIKSLKRQDSGYESMSDDDAETEADKEPPRSRSGTPLPTDTTHLEFTNYSHVDVKRRGSKTSKRYAFEYWGTTYAWKRVSRRDGPSKEISYHLVNSETQSTVAHIVPAPLTTAERELEDAKGGWVPPCSLWISDEKILSGLTDVADVIVATGLVALVDDCIRTRWHSKHSIQLTLPTLLKSPLKMNMEYVGPKRLIEEVFNRRGNTVTRRPTPLRQNSAKI